MASEFDVCLLHVDARGALKDLDNGAVATDFEDLAGTGRAVGKCQVDNLIETGEFDIFENDQGTIDTADRVVIETGRNVEALGNGLRVEFD